MSITDESTIDHAQIWRRDVDEAEAKWLASQARTTELLADYVALVLGKPRPSDTPVQIFAGDVEAGDQIQWLDGWWYVTGTDEGSDIADVVLTASRVGYEAIQLEFAGNVLLTTVRGSS